jgi:uncharacterized membrane protein YcaP (DUF421 family)
LAAHWIIFGRSIAAFLLLLFVTRMLGKQTLSTMNLHEFVTAVILGAIAANLAFNEKIQISHLIISLGVFAVVSYILLKLSLKNRKLRKLLTGAPSVIIQNGMILEDNMKKNKFTLDSLNEMLREKNVFNPDEVEYALLESNGRLSVMLKPQFRPITLQDMKLPMTASKGIFPIEIIMDGKWMQDNLNHSNIDSKQVIAELKNRNRTVQDVFYAVKGSDGCLYFDFYADNLRHPIDSE